MARRAPRILLAGAVGAVVLAALMAVPAPASASRHVWVTPQAVTVPGAFTIHKSNARRCKVAIAADGFRGHMRRKLSMTLNAHAHVGRTKVKVTCGRRHYVTYFNAVSSSPAPSPAPPAQSQGLPPYPWTSPFVPMTASPEGISGGPYVCQNGVFTRGVPFVTSPTGSVVYARDALFTRPANGSSGWTVSQYGPLYYSGTALGMAIAWANYNTNQIAPQDAMDSFTVPAGTQAAIVQYVWDAGVWYGDYALCNF